MSAINRDKAIEAIEDELDKIDHVPQWVFDRLTNRLRELPSVEPHWIPCSERLPEENYLDDGYVEPSQPVLVYMSYHCYKVSRYWGHRKTKGTSDYVIPDWMDLEYYDGDNVLAWMPVPKKYKGN